MRYFLQLVTEDQYINEAYEYAQTLISRKLHTRAFYDGSVQKPEDFIALALNPQVYLFLVIDSKFNRVAGHTHLTNFAGKTAHVHFSIHPLYHGKDAIIMGNECIQQYFSIQREDTSPLLTSLIGLTPITNSLAIKFLHTCDFQDIYTMPDACEINGEFTSGLLTVRHNNG